MPKRISLIVLNGSGSSVGQFSIAKFWLWMFGGLLTVTLGALGYFIHDYNKLRQTNADLCVIEEQFAYQGNQLSDQRQQIQKFADDINSLKTKLVSLDRFEQKIRILADIEKPENQSNLFGIGGSIPEDLSPQISLEENPHKLIRQMHEQVALLNDASSQKNQSFDALFEKLQLQQNILAATPTIRPVESGWVSSRFGYRKSPFTGRKEFHKGYDISARRGSPILATANGTVVYTGKKGFLGKLLEINHGRGVVTRYAHLDKYLKKPGDKVKRGDPIATVGNTGRSTGPHLHYEVRLNGMPVNPEKHILND